MADLNSLREEIVSDLTDLSLNQLTLLKKATTAFAKTKVVFERLPQSDLITDAGLDYFGNALVMHHATTSQAFKKDKFEHLFRDTCNFQKSDATYAVLSPANFPGADLRVGTERFALKTQADQNIKRDVLTLTKWMELGRGDWTDKIDHLKGLTNQFLAHLQKYDRILVLRCLSDSNPFEYQLVEIPKAIFSNSHNATYRFSEVKKPIGPEEARPGYGDVYDVTFPTSKLYNFYFDGRGERKLHIQNISISRCLVHARWRFGV